VTTALAAEVGYGDGWAPPLAFRAGTTSRTPDGVLFTVRSGQLSSTHTFLTDPTS
jgi:hypothetical protein